jgi:hypothetical protein
MPRRRRATTRRRSVRRRLTRSNAKSGAKILGRSSKNIVTGAVLYEGVTRLAGNQTAQLGTMQLPANMILTGLSAELIGGGQKDFISAGTKIGTKRLIDRFILPRVFGARSNGQTASAAQGGY